MKSALVLTALLVAFSLTTRADSIEETFNISLDPHSTLPYVFLQPSTDPLTVNAYGSLGAFQFVGDSTNANDDVIQNFEDHSGDIFSVFAFYTLATPAGADPDYIERLPGVVVFGVALECESIQCQNEFGLGEELGFGNIGLPQSGYDGTDAITESNSEFTARGPFAIKAYCDSLESPANEECRDQLHNPTYSQSTDQVVITPVKTPELDTLDSVAIGVGALGLMGLRKRRDLASRIV